MEYTKILKIIMRALILQYSLMWS